MEVSRVTHHTETRRQHSPAACAAGRIRARRISTGTNGVVTPAHKGDRSREGNQSAVTTVYTLTGPILEPNRPRHAPV